MRLHFCKYALIALIVPSSVVRADESKDKKDDAKPKVVVLAAAEAKKHVGEECTVEMTVKASKNAKPRETYYLDSEESYKNDDNVAVLIAYADAAKFKEAGIADPAEHYKGKTIRVTGKILHESDRVRIKVTDPKQIVVATPEGKKTP